MWFNIPGSEPKSFCSRLEEFRDRFKLGKDNSTVRQYEYDNSTSQECNAIMKEFESSTFNQATFQAFLDAAGDTLVVVDFFTG